jgi:hypothetical protein
MARRADPANIDAAQRAGVRARHIGEGVLPDSAEAWIAAFEAREARDVNERWAYGTPVGTGSPRSGNCGGCRSR